MSETDEEKARSFVGGYHLASSADPEDAVRRLVLLLTEARASERRKNRPPVATGTLWLCDEDARESYARFLREEIGRIDNGGAHPPWMSRQEAISSLEFELSRLDEEA